MRVIPLVILAAMIAAPIHASESSLSSVCHPEEGIHGRKAHNDVLPFLRFELTPRFCYDEAACFFLGEYGHLENRSNLSVGFPFCEKQYLKLGGEILNERLTYNFPCKNGKRWVRQYAGGVTYLLGLDFWGFKGFEISGQYSNAQREYVHHYEIKKKRRTYYQRAVCASKSYTGSVGVRVSPFCGFGMKADVIYDRVEYELKYSDKKIVEGVGGAITLRQQLCSSIALELKGEIRKPYSYYEGSLKWTTLFERADVTWGIFGGHTVGRHRLPNSTIAGFEIGVDFGLDNYSGSSSIGVCGSYDYGGFIGQDIDYLRWLATPAVYMPEVLTISEQRVATHAEIKREHHRHHHHHHKDRGCCGNRKRDIRRFNPYDYRSGSSSSSSGVFFNDPGFRGQQYYREQAGGAPFINEYPEPI